MAFSLKSLPSSLLIVPFILHIYFHSHHFLETPWKIRCSWLPQPPEDFSFTWTDFRTYHHWPNPLIMLLRLFLLHLLQVFIFSLCSSLIVSYLVLITTSISFIFGLQSHSSSIFPLASFLKSSVFVLKVPSKVMQYLLFIEFPCVSIFLSTLFLFVLCI